MVWAWRTTPNGQRADHDGHTLMVWVGHHGSVHWSWYVPSDDHCPHITGRVNSGRMDPFKLFAEAKRLAEAAAATVPTPEPEEGA